MSVKTSYRVSRLILITLFALIILCVTTSCSDNKRASWTILVYMAADNNLTNQAIEDIIQMEQAKVASSINVIVQLDPNQHSYDPQARRYKIRHNNYSGIDSPVVEYLGEIDSGSYLSLADFVNWGISRYPANRYALVIWSHGSGWTRDESGTRWISPDSHSISQMSIANGDYQNAFRLFAEKLDLLIVDACFMQTIEVITEVYRYTDYVVGSQNSVPFEGFPYREILTGWSKNSPTEQIAKRVVSEYIVSHLPSGSQNPQGFTRRTTCSAAKSAKLPAFLNELKQFSNVWFSEADSDAVSFARQEAYPFNMQESDVDIKEFFTRLYDNTTNVELKSDIAELLTTIDRVFIAQGSDNLPENTGTATIWYPTYYEFFSGSRELYNRLDFSDTDWLLFLEHTFEQ